MRKYLPLLLSACALSYAGYGVAADPTATIDPVKRGQAPANADAKEKRSSDAAAGATRDSDQKATKPAKRAKRMRKDVPANERSTDSSNSGPTTGGRY